MKLINKSYALICVIAAIAFFHACEKSSDIGTKPVSAVEKARLSIRLSGDITTIETPMAGGRQSINDALAKTLYDSTIYAVDVRSGNHPYAVGLFNKADHIVLEVPKDTSFTIRVAAIKRGTGIGLFWGITTGNYQYFRTPVNRRLMNEMEYVSALAGTPWAIDSLFLSSMSYHSVRADVIAGGEDIYLMPELDSYFGSSTLTVTDTAASLNISLKRISFGVTYQVPGFSEGTLIADYDSLMKTQQFVPAGIAGSMRIYTADAYRFGEDLAGGMKIPLTLKWKKADGSLLTVAQTQLAPRRNSLTTINVTLPSPEVTQASIVLTDTTFTGNQDVNF